MKRQLIYAYLSFGLFFVSVNSADAQVVIKSNMMPAAGQNIIYTTSNDSIDLSLTGPNTNWDFSGIAPVSQDTFKYLSPTKANPLYTLSFYGDVALEVKTGGLTGLFDFFKTSTADYRAEGMGFTIPVLKVPTPITYDRPDIVYHFPLSYTSKPDSCVFSGTATVSGFSIKILGKRVNTVDGWGTIKTPYKTYNCIRVKSVVQELDTFLIAAVNNSRVEYKWLTTTEQIPVMEAIVTRNATTGKLTTVLHYRDSYKVIVNPNGPVVDFDVPDTNVMTNDTVAFNNMTTGALAYNWTIIPAKYTTVAGAGTTSKNPKVIFTAPGVYSVSLSATNISGSNTLIKKNYIVVSHNTGISTNVIDNGMVLYPNPAKGGFYLHFNSIQNPGITILNVSNIFGQTILQKTINSRQNDEFIDLNGLSPGVYQVRCQNAGKSYLDKIVVR
jgi:PKD repeat protein